LADAELPPLDFDNLTDTLRRYIDEVLATRGIGKPYHPGRPFRPSLTSHRQGLQ